MKSTQVARNIDGLARGSGRPRRGVALSLELMIALPVVLGLVLAIVQFALVARAKQQLAILADQAARYAALPATSKQQVKELIADGLKKVRLARGSQYALRRAKQAGGPVQVVIRTPMPTAAPNLLAIIGLSWNDKSITVQSIRRRE